MSNFKHPISMFANLPKNIGLNLGETLPFQTNFIAILIWYLALTGLLIYLIKSKLLTYTSALLIFTGSLIISLPMLKSGLLYPYGMGFWGPNGHDGIWHLALIEHFTHHLNLASPLLAHTQLSNYHFLFDWLLAVINRITPGISPITFYFQIIPPLMAILLGLLTYKFMLVWTRSSSARSKSSSAGKSTGYLALILIYSGGGLGWIVNLYRGQPLGGESMFWSTQSISMLINPPFAFSLILMLTALLLFNRYLGKPTSYLLLSTSLIFGLLVHAKSYAGLLALSSLGILSLPEIFNIIKNKSLKIENRKLKILILASLISFLTLLPVLNLKSRILNWNPLWFPHTMLLFSDRLNWPRLYNAIQVYWATGNWVKGILADSLAITIFYVGNLGIRIIGLWAIFRALWKPSLRGLHKARDVAISSSKHINEITKIRKFENSKIISHYLLLITFLSAIIPLFFTQTATPWNTIQFLYYTLFFLSLFTAKVLGKWLDDLTPSPSPNRRGAILPLLGEGNRMGSVAKIAIFSTIFAINLPTTIGTLSQYLPYRAPSRIPYEELSALEFLQSQPDGRVLTYPFNENTVAQYAAPRPLANYVSTAYVSAISSHPVYLEDEINLEITGADWQPARQKSEQFFYTLNESTARDFITQNQIQYLYILKGQEPNLPPEQLNFQKTFDNGLVKIYQNTSK